MRLNADESEAVEAELQRFLDAPKAHHQLAALKPKGWSPSGCAGKK